MSITWNSGIVATYIFQKIKGLNIKYTFFDNYWFISIFVLLVECYEKVIFDNDSCHVDLGVQH